MSATLTRDDGTSIAYSVQDGDGPAVVLLHGLAGSSRELLPTARALAGRRVILIDQRAHGASTTHPNDVSREAFVGDVVAVIEAEAHGPVDVVGQSMGAHTAMLVAAARPDLVGRLVMLEGNQGSGDLADVQALGDFFRSWPVPFASRDAALAHLGESPVARAWVDDLDDRGDGLFPRFDADVMQRVLAEVITPRWREWESVNAATLVIYADGGMFSEHEKAEFVRRGRRARRVDLVGASHDAHLDAFEQWVDTLRGFLEG